MYAKFGESRANHDGDWHASLRVGWETFFKFLEMSRCISAKVPGSNIVTMEG